MEAVPVGFGSDDYFALVAARPELGRYFALGDHVIVVVDGTAYEVREGDAPRIDVPGPDPTPLPDNDPTPAPAEEPTPLPTDNTMTDQPETLLEAIVQVITGLIESIVESLER
jgi:hypothetical protein